MSLNKVEFNKTHQQVRRLLDINNAKEGDIRVGENESLEHQIMKVLIRHLTYNWVIPENIPTIIKEHMKVKMDSIEISGPLDYSIRQYRQIPRDANGKIKKWAKPRCYFEARFSKNLTPDALLFTIHGVYVIENVITETARSIKRKKRNYQNMSMNLSEPIEFLEVRV